MGCYLWGGCEYCQRKEELQQCCCIFCPSMQEVLFLKTGTEISGYEFEVEKYVLSLCY